MATRARVSRVLCVWLAVLTLTLSWGGTPVRAFIVTLDAKQEDCYVEYVRQKRTAFMRVGVLSSADKYDVRLRAFGPFREAPVLGDMRKNFFDQMITTERDESNQNLQHNGFNFKSEHRGGWYKFCVDNFHSSKNGKVVEFYTSFDMTDENDFANEDMLEAATRQEHIEGVESSLERLKTLLDLIRHEQDYYRAREHRHRQTIDSNNARVMWYTVMEIVTLGVLYGFQSFILHKWFSDRGFLAKRQWV